MAPCFRWGKAGVPARAVTTALVTGLVDRDGHRFRPTADGRAVLEAIIRVRVRKSAE